MFLYLSLRRLIQRTMVVIGIIALAVGAFNLFAPDPDPAPEAALDRDAVRHFVITFGDEFKDVALYGPDAQEDIREEYRGYATDELIATWEESPWLAPGRTSPQDWPERLEIDSVTPLSAEVYRVEGTVLQARRRFLDTSEIVATYPVVAMVAKRDASMRIVDFSKDTATTTMR